MKRILTILLALTLCSFLSAKGKPAAKGHHNTDKGPKHQKHDDSKNHAHDFTKGKKHGHKGHDHDNTADHDHDHAVKGKGKAKNKGPQKQCDCKECDKDTKTVHKKGGDKHQQPPVAVNEGGHDHKHKTKAKGKGKGKGHAYGKHKVKGNNGLGNGIDPAPPGKAPVNDSTGTPGQPDNKRK